MPRIVVRGAPQCSVVPESASPLMVGRLPGKGRCAWWEGRERAREAGRSIRRRAELFGIGLLAGTTSAPLSQDGRSRPRGRQPRGVGPTDSRRSAWSGYWRCQLGIARPRSAPTSPPPPKPIPPKRATASPVLQSLISSPQSTPRPTPRAPPISAPAMAPVLTEVPRVQSVSIVVAGSRSGWRGDDTTSSVGLLSRICPWCRPRVGLVTRTHWLSFRV